MTRSYANFGRPLSSSAGSVPVLAYCRMVPRRMYGLGGQPGILTTGLFLMIWSTPTAPVGFGPDDGMPPHDAHDPIEMTAAAWLATSLRTSTPHLPASLR